jgi:hypothetical protein
VQYMLLLSQLDASIRQCCHSSAAIVIPRKHSVSLRCRFQGVRPMKHSCANNFRSKDSSTIDLELRLSMRH